MKQISYPATIITDRHTNWLGKDKYKFTVQLSNQKEISLNKYIKKFTRNRMFRSPAKRIEIPELSLENRLEHIEHSRTAILEYFKIRKKIRKEKLKVARLRKKTSIGTFALTEYAWKENKYSKMDKIEKEIIERIKKYWPPKKKKPKKHRKKVFVTCQKNI